MSTSGISVFILGTAQDGGYPHVGCTKDCCLSAWNNPSIRRMVSSIALIDENNKKIWIVDVTPDIKSQLHILKKYYSWIETKSIDGFFITHSHYGHYSGLLNFGLEVMNLKEIDVYTMPKMKNFLINNISTKRLIDDENIIIQSLCHETAIVLNENLKIIPFIVPHRSENTETVGFKIQSESKSLIYIPDIDSWNIWDQNILEVISQNDFSFLDGTFFNDDELEGRDMSKVPHPLISESMNLFSSLDKKDKRKVFFTHLNHTNKIINPNSPESDSIVRCGYNIAQDCMVIDL